MRRRLVFPDRQRRIGLDHDNLVGEVDVTVIVRDDDEQFSARL
jgi:hypothetical protein